jgi:hypothetical protein
MRKTIGILVNPGFPYAADEVHQIEAAAHGLGQQVLILRASTPAEFDAAFDLVTREHIRAPIGACTACLRPWLCGSDHRSASAPPKYPAWALRYPVSHPDFTG